MSKVIAFDKTHETISTTLNIGDYMDATSYDAGPFFGFIKVVHMSPKYPQYHNLKWENNSYMIFTGKRWEKRELEDILGNLIKEKRIFTEYVQTHGGFMLGIIEGLKEVEKITTFRI